MVEHQPKPHQATLHRFRCHDFDDGRRLTHGPVASGSAFIHRRRRDSSGAARAWNVAGEPGRWPTAWPWLSTLGTLHDRLHAVPTGGQSIGEVGSLRTSGWPGVAVACRNGSVRPASVVAVQVGRITPAASFSQTTGVETLEAAWSSSSRTKMGPTARSLARLTKPVSPGTWLDAEFLFSPPALRDRPMVLLGA